MKKEPDGISIHAPPRGATRTISEGRMLEVISIHAPPRGATLIRLSVLPRRKVFQFTPLREGRRRDRGGCRRPGDFNSRPSARGDVRTWSNWDGTSISIHAPPRGATIPDDVDGSADFISIHAPPRGATPARFSLRASCTYFNSRPSARGDGCAFFCVPPAPIFQFTPLREGRRWLPRTGTNPPSISIHAPPRGATATALLPASEVRISIHAPPRGATRGRCAVRADDIFQFTPLREGRLFQVFCIPTEEIFQFTPLREGRRPHLEQLGRHVYFNSRPSARGDPLRFCSLQPLQDFNSRPSARGDSRIAARCKLTLHFNSRPSARGDTYGSQGRRGLCYFNSRPSARGDRREVRKPHRGGISIHAPPRGATSACTSGLVFPHLFQFTPLREGRLGQNAGKRRGIYFNSRPSARGDASL